MSGAEEGAVLWVNQAVGHDVGAELTKDEALLVTAKIKGYAGVAWLLLYEAHQRKAHTALGYATWADYVETEFDMSRSHSYRLISQAKVVHELAAAVSPMGDIVLDVSERAARDLAPVIDEAKAAAVEAVEGLPEDATDDEKSEAVNLAVQTVRERTVTETTTTTTFNGGTGEVLGAEVEAAPTPAPSAPGSAPESDAFQASDSDDGAGGETRHREEDPSPAEPPAPDPIRFDPDLWAAFLAGFNLSGGGFNGEWPYRDHGKDPAEDEDIRQAFVYWSLNRDEAAV